VALAAGCIWSGMRISEMSGTPHLPFVAFWLVAAWLAVLWNSAVARHLVGVAALGWIATVFFGYVDRTSLNPLLPVTACSTLLLGAGLMLAHLASGALRALGLTLSTYASFALALMLSPVGIHEFLSLKLVAPNWALLCGLLGTGLAFATAAIVRRGGPAFAGLALTCALIVASGWAGALALPQPWTIYVFALASMLCLVISGMLDEVRPRLVAGWLGLGLMIAGITWSVRGSLLRRAAFLAVSGIAAVVIATVLGRLLPSKEAAR